MQIIESDKDLSCQFYSSLDIISLCILKKNMLEVSKNVPAKQTQLELKTPKELMNHLFY